MNIRVPSSKYSSFSNQIIRRKTGFPLAWSDGLPKSCLFAIFRQVTVLSVNVLLLANLFSDDSCLVHKFFRNTSNISASSSDSPTGPGRCWLNCIDQCYFSTKVRAGNEIKIILVFPKVNQAGTRNFFK